MRVIDVDPQASFQRSRVGLHLLGGGITGAYFHYGAIAALDDHLSRKINQFDIYTGISAGSLPATTSAVGLNPQVALQSIVDEENSILFIKRRDIYRFSLLKWTSQFFKTLWTIFYITYLKLEHAEDAPTYFWGLKDALPSGMFSMKYYERWIKDNFIKNKFPLFFSELQKKLLIPAFDLDSGRRVVFGSEGYRHIPFSKAITASSAIPIFFEPVEIENHYYVDGGLGDAAHLDVSASAGADLIILLNPMVPIRNDLESVKIKTVYDEKGRIQDKGFTYVYDQCLRNDIRQKVQQAMRHMGYLYPNVDILLIEPDATDPTMFMFNPMDFESRKQIVDYAYNLTKRKMTENSELWRRTLDRHQITVAGIE